MTVELKSGINREPRREDYCMKSSAVAPAVPGTPCPLWMGFLNKVTNSDQEMIGFLRRFLGYCLTGHVHEQVLVFLFGTGANGKSVFVSTVSGIMGDYATVAPMVMFVASKYERHPTEIAKLQGVRLVVAQETQKGREWDEAKIKALTGGDKLTGRFMRGDFFDFKPTHKLLISGNHKPSLRNVDEAIRRRFLLVPFTVQIPPAERDTHFANKLKAEWPAILRWIIDGCLEWQRDGLRVPKAIQAASAEYLADNDAFGQWVDEKIVDLPNDRQHFTSSRELFKSWKEWCEAGNVYCGTEVAFVESLKNRDYAQGRNAKGLRGFKGIRIRDVAYQPPMTVETSVADDAVAG